MIDDPYILLGISAGVLCVLAYVLTTVRHQTRKVLLSDGVMLFLATSGIAAGIKVCTIALNRSLLTTLKEERTYIFLGGLAVIWVSVDTVIRIFREK